MNDDAAHPTETTIRCDPEFETKGEEVRGAERPVGQVVLVLQGGGALGAYQAGAYQALSEAGIEPNWVIGTSIGAFNGAIIAGNEPASRPSRLREFWSRIADDGVSDDPWTRALWGLSTAGVRALTRGVPGLFKLRPSAAWSLRMPVGVERASLYTTDALRETLSEFVDFDSIASKHPRLTVGAVNVRTGQMQYFDSRRSKLRVEHVMASGALPPGFPAVNIDGEPYWDGSVYSNTPLEIVFDDNPRRDSLIFAVNMWHAEGPEPKSIFQVLGRQQDIWYASRDESHIARQEQLHRLRHVVRELVKRIPAKQRNSAEVEELAAYGCYTNMQVVRLLAPRSKSEDLTMAINFTSAGIEDRWQEGYAAMQQVLKEKPWHNRLDPLRASVVHESR